MTDAVVHAEKLTKRYGPHLALDELDLDVEPGEVLGFLGPNGAGKTTTIRLLLDLIRPTSGRIELFGGTGRPEDATTRQRIGYLPGELALPARQRAGELLTYLGRLRGGVPKNRIRDLADRFDLDLSRPIRALSRGNKQKVGLIQAVMHRPDLVILDEPTSGLDPLLQQEFLRLAKEIADRGQTVFMSSHMLSEVQDVADRVAFLRAGRLITITDVQTLRDTPIRRLEIRFDRPPEPTAFAALPGLSDLRITGTTLTCRVNGSADALVKAAAQHTVVSLLAEEPDLEEVFLAYYSGDETATAPAAKEPTDVH